ncbi:MAG TPA: sensor domain-containing diguanylate cyclase [Acidobacterium sp.]|nr:sensor domain-containing diguanylate cyclase [Acidobacterium sp.]
MSMRQLLFGYALALAVFLAGTYVVERGGYTVRGLRRLRAGLGLGIFALCLLGARDWIPLFLLSLVAQPALVLAFSFMHRALAEVIHRPPRLKWYFLTVFPVYLAGQWYFTFVHPSLQGRDLVATSGVALVFVVTLLILQGVTSPALQSHKRIMDGLLIVMILLRVLRIIRAVYAPPVNRAQTLTPVDSLLIYLSLITGLAFIAAIMWLSLSAQRDELRLMAETDGLTGLLNRRAFEEILRHELRSLDGSKADTALLLLDIDQFKTINDDLGHLAGDEVIRRVSTAIKTAARPSDVLARFGGDEFVVLLRHLNGLQAMAVAERFRFEIAALQGLPNHLTITASVGLAFLHGMDSPYSLIGRADEALYRSKSNGRNRVSVGDDFEPGEAGSSATTLVSL